MLFNHIRDVSHFNFLFCQRWDGTVGADVVDADGDVARIQFLTVNCKDRLIADNGMSLLFQRLGQTGVPIVLGGFKVAFVIQYDALLDRNLDGVE